ncbi:MAG TPA: tRNA adenosine(34) deaminase TadA [Abditibacteriaceae bacterium]
MSDELTHTSPDEYSQDEQWMREALAEARLALRSSSSNLRDDVPIGAICVRNGATVAHGHNQREINNDPTAHAEVLAIREASRVLNSNHLSDVTLYVTLEPCAMCAGAIWLARIGRVVFGAWDEKAGACGSVFDVARDPRLNHRPQLCGGVLESECETLLSEFFNMRRKP